MTQQELNNLIINFKCKQADLSYKYANNISGGKINDCLKNKLKLSVILLDMISCYDADNLDENCLSESQLEIIINKLKEILGGCNCN